MNFQEIFKQLLNSKDPLNTFKELREEISHLKLRKSEIESATNSLKEAITRRRPGRALTAARSLLLLAGPDKMLKQMQRIHALRPSQQGFNNTTSQLLIADLVENSALYNFSQTKHDYLNSISALWLLAPSLRQLQRSLIDRMRLKRPYTIKTLLAIVDSAFAYDFTVDLEASTDTMQSYSAESLAQAFSYLLTLYHKAIGLSTIDLGLVDEESAWDSYYKLLLIDAAKISEYLEAELLIESLPYTSTSLDRIVNINSIDPNLERSVRLGYIQFEFQKDIRNDSLHRMRNSINTRTTSISNFAFDFYSRTDDKFLKFVKHPKPRYVITLPSHEKIHELFSSDTLFLEDIFSLKILGAEDYVEPERIIYTPVSGEINVIDIIKTQRLFSFLQQGIKFAINNHHPTFERQLIHLTSCIPVFKRSDIQKMLSIVLGEKKSLEILNLLTSDHSSNYIDLQYAPVISIKNWCMLSISVASLSNLVRNILCHADTRLELKGDNKKDPMEENLTAAFQSADFLVAHNHNLGQKNNPLETDIIAYRDGHLFLIECKNAFHPCNVYEQRNSYDHIVKGAEQLNLRKAWISLAKNQKTLFNNLNWTATPDAKIHTCIAIGNRVFNGYCLEGHPIRQAHEMINLLTTGEINLNHTIYRVWRNDDISVNDFCDYLDGSIIINEFMSSMEPVTRIIKFADMQLHIHSYALNTQLLTRKITEKYPTKINQNYSEDT